MDVVISSAVRSPIGLRGASLAGWHPVDLLGEIFDQLMATTGLSAGDLDQIVTVCSTAAGEQAFNVGRNAAVAAGWPPTIAALALEGGPGTGFEALRIAALLVESGQAEAVVVAGVDSASRVSAGAATSPGFGKPFGPRFHKQLAKDAVEGMLAPADRMQALADEFELGRAELDRYTWATMNRGCAYQPDFMVPLSAKPNNGPKSVDFDDRRRQSIDPAEFRPAFHPDGMITAANSAPPADAAAAVLVTSPRFAQRHGLSPWAEISAVAMAGQSVTGASSGWEISQRLMKSAAPLPEVAFVYEDSAATPLAWARDSGFAAAQINPIGGALSTGEARGAAGLILVAELAEHLRIQKLSAGLAVAAGATDSSAGLLLTACD